MEAYSRDNEENAWMDSKTFAEKMFDKSHIGGRLNLGSHPAFDACIRLSTAESPDSGRFCGSMRWSSITCLFAPFYNIN